MLLIKNTSYIINPPYVFIIPLIELSTKDEFINTNLLKIFNTSSKIIIKTKLAGFVFIEDETLMNKT
jgi:hypothetical protein